MKKLISLVLALVLVLTAVSAFAEEVQSPSKTVKDTVKVTTVTDVDGNPVEAEAVVIADDPMAAAVMPVIAEKGIDFFGDEIAEAIKTTLGENSSIAASFTIENKSDKAINVTLEAEDVAEFLPVKGFVVVDKDNNVSIVPVDSPIVVPAQSIVTVYEIV